MLYYYNYGYLIIFVPVSRPFIPVDFYASRKKLTYFI